MSQQSQDSRTDRTIHGRVAVNAIRQSIAHFFGSEKEDRAGTTVPNHTLRDIGVDRTVYDYL